MVASFYCETPELTPLADDGFDTWRQLETLALAQKHWSDQAVSCTIYYRREEIAKIKEWMGENLKNIKTISFLCHNDHGFVQAPLEAISEIQYRGLTAAIKPIRFDQIQEGSLDSLECAGGVCPIK
jgi:hypothetical protein